VTELSRRFFRLDVDTQDDVYLKALDRLADEDPLRTVVFLRVEYHGESLRKVADDIGVTKSTVWKAKTKAAELLAEIVESELDARGIRPRLREVK